MKKKLLIVTQKVDIQDPILGFFHEWLNEFSSKWDSVTVIAQSVGKYSLPANVKILSLGKEKKVGKAMLTLNFLKYVFLQKNNYTHVLVHMTPIYVIIGAPLWRIFGVKISLWYTHRCVDLKLKLAHFFVDTIFTASKEGFGIVSNKTRVVGHGIVVSDFTNISRRETGNIIRLVTVGRITTIKNIDTLLYALVQLKKDGVCVRLTIVGDTYSEADKEYNRYLHRIVDDGGIGDSVIFAGSVPHSHVKDFFADSDININLAPTGGMDKAALEGMAAKMPTLVSNEAFFPIIKKYRELLFVRERDAKDLSKKISFLKDKVKREEVGLELQRRVNENFNLSRLVDTITTILNETSK